MSGNRIIPVLIVAAFLVCFCMMGVPWGSSLPCANFSGHVVYSVDDGRFELSGSYNLYNCETMPSSVNLRMIVGAKEQEIELNPASRTFSGAMKVKEFPGVANAWAELIVDGEVVAKGKIDLPDDDQPKVHIIRFTSLS